MIDKCSCGYAHMLSHFSRVQLFATLWISQPGSSLHGILQARILEWVAILSSRGLPNPGIDPRSPILQADSLPSEPPQKLPEQTPSTFRDSVRILTGHGLKFFSQS